MSTATIDQTEPTPASPAAPSTASDVARRSEPARSVDGIGRLRMVMGNTVISLLGQCITWLSTLVLTIAYGRFLGPNGFGELYLAITLVGLIGFPLEFGFNQQIIRDVAQTPERAHRFLSSALILKTALWVPLLGLLTLVTWILHYNAEERALVTICGITLFATAIGAAFGSMHYAVHRNVVPVFGSILEKTLDAAVAFALLRFLGVGVIPVAWTLLGGALVNTVWQATLFYRVERPTFSFDLPLIREIVTVSIPFLVYGVLGVIYYRIDTVMLGAMDGDTVVGWYGAGYRIFDTLIFLPSLVMSTIMYPVMTRLSNREPHALRLAVEKSTNFLLVAGMPLAVGFGVAAPAIVGFLYHHAEFEHTVGVMRALAPGLILLYINSVISSLIISVKREHVMTWMAGGALVLNVSLNFLLIPRFHEVAAAGVTSFTELMLLAAGLYFMPADLRPVGSLATLVKALAASAAMAGVILALSQQSILVILPAACCAYVAAGAGLRLIPREDIRAMLAAVRHKGSGSRRVASAESPLSSSATTGVVSAALGENSRFVQLSEAFGPDWPARLEWLQTAMSAAERARIVTRARSSSGPLMAGQRLTPRVMNRSRQGGLATSQHASTRLESPSTAPSGHSRRGKTNRQRRGSRKRSAA